MARQIGFRGFLCAGIAAVWPLGAGVSSAEPLQLVTDIPNKRNFNDEVLRQVFASMGQDASVEFFVPNRAWRMVLRGERDGMINAMRTSELDGICSFPEEPLGRDRWVLYVRTADVGKPKFSSFNDLVGHDVAVREQVPGSFEQPSVSPDLREFLREHHNLVETISGYESLHMLAAGRVDYAVVNLRFGMENFARLGLSGKIEPLSSRSVFEDSFYVCLTKARVSPSFVEALSRALRQLKQTKAYQAIIRKFSP